MRNAVFITSILFAAVACDRDSTTSSDRLPSPERVTGSTGTTGPSGATTHVPGEGRGATGTTSRIGSTEPTGTPGSTDSSGTTGSTGSRGTPATEGSRESVTSSGTYTPTGPDAASGGQVTGPSAGIAQSSDHALSCSQLIPRSVQRQYLPNMTITPTSHGTDISTNCRIEGSGVDPAAAVQAWCNPDEESAIQPETPTKPASSKGIGKTAILVEGDELQHLVAWDSDSSCQITLAVPKSVDAIALGRRMLDTLPAKPIPGTGRGEG